ncbi:MAG: glycosyl hydrolase, partial [Myxococcota bacterium]
MWKSLRLFAAASLFFVLACAQTGSRPGWWKPPEDAPDREVSGPFKNISYRLIGPATGGRVTRVSGIPGDPHVYWVATAAGGVWRSVNGGRSWSPVFDDQPISSIGSIAVAPSDSNVIWVGSGEANIRGNVAEGNGIYRSNDGGNTWAHVWKAEGQIGEIIVHPENPEIVFAAALGSPFGPSEERGIYRTLDGGKTWSRVLHVDADTGASDVCFDPSEPNVLFAGTWQTRRTPWSHTSGGPGSGLWRSDDGGATWVQLKGGGLPGGTWGKVGVQVAASDSKRVYALIEADDGGLFRSDDGGSEWRRINDSAGLRQRAWYYTHITIDPTDEDVVWFPEVRMLHTTDGGKTVRSVPGGGWDYHDVWIDPVDPSRI